MPTRIRTGTNKAGERTRWLELGNDECDRVEKTLRQARERFGRCPICGFEPHRYIPRDDEPEPCGECKTQIEWLRLFAYAEISPKWWRVDWDEIGIAHKSLIDSFCEEFDPWKPQPFGLTLVGPYGTGKTLTAAHIAKVLLVCGTNVRFVKFNKLVRAYGDDDDRYSTTPVLIVDDVEPGISDKQRDFYEERLFEIVDDRYEGMRPTIFTSNMEGDEFEERFPRIVSRLSEYNRLLEYDGEDMRKSADPITEGALKL